MHTAHTRVHIRIGNPFPWYQPIERARTHTRAQSASQSAYAYTISYSTHAHTHQVIRYVRVAIAVAWMWTVCALCAQTIAIRPYYYMYDNNHGSHIERTCLYEHSVCSQKFTESVDLCVQFSIVTRLRWVSLCARVCVCVYWCVDVHVCVSGEAEKL